MKQALDLVLNHKVKNNQLVLTLLNVMYGVFLGVFSQYLIDFNSEQDAPKIKLLIDHNNVFFVMTFFIYFIIDWFSANITLLFEEGINHLLLLFAIIFILWLGFIVIDSLDPSSFLFLSFGVYSCIASFFDIKLKYTTEEINAMHEVMKKHIFFVIRLILSICLIFFSIILISNANSESGEIFSIICHTTLTMLVVAKVFRYFWLIHLKCKLEDQTK